MAVTFQIYQGEQGGEPLWTETQTIAIDPSGHYKAQLGAASLNGIPLDLFANGDARWLEAQIAGQPLQPRVLLVSVPYAMKSADAGTLGGLPPSAFVRAGAWQAANPVGGVLPALVSPVTTTGGIVGHVPLFSDTATVRGQGRARHPETTADPIRRIAIDAQLIEICLVIREQQPCQRPLSPKAPKPTYTTPSSSKSPGRCISHLGSKARISPELPFPVPDTDPLMVIGLPRSS
jgi:hypothetical protein